jgi:hypothetical protein
MPHSVGLLHGTGTPLPQLTLSGVAAVLCPSVPRGAVLRHSPLGGYVLHGGALCLIVTYRTALRCIMRFDAEVSCAIPRYVMSLRARLYWNMSGWTVLCNALRPGMTLCCIARCLTVVLCYSGQQCTARYDTFTTWDYFVPNCAAHSNPCGDTTVCFTLVHGVPLCCNAGVRYAIRNRTALHSVARGSAVLCYATTDRTVRR